MDPDARRAALVDHLVAQGYVKDPRVVAALRRVPRHAFLPGLEDEAYRDAPLGIGHGQTISAPHMVALMAEALDARPGMRVLEVGAGSGYHASVVAELVQPGGKVVTVERVESLAAVARRCLAGAGVGPDRVEVVVGDGSLGWPAAAPYDRAYLTCAAPALPAPILEQLKPGGRLLAPVGSRREQELVLAEKTGQGIRERGLGGCVFVPLLGRHGFPEARWT